MTSTLTFVWSSEFNGEFNIIDDMEFLNTKDDNTIEHRAAARPGSPPSSQTTRLNQLRLALQYIEIPVLRNSKRTLIFVESDRFDTFGSTSTRDQTIFGNMVARESDDKVQSL